MISSPHFHDVTVVGSGPAGIGAAIGAARAGARTVLLEGHGIAGGMGSTALVNNFCNAHYDGKRMIIGGVFGELRDRLIDRGALYITGGMEPYHHEVMVEEAVSMLHEAGVKVHYHSRVTQVCFTGNSSTLSLENGAEIKSAAVVDATGDAHIAAQGGAPCTMGKAVMPLTYCYLIGPVDLAALREARPDAFRKDLRKGEPYIYLGGQDWLVKAVSQARECGELTIPRKRIAVAYGLPGQPEIVSVNFGRVSITDPTNREELARASREGLRQVHEGVAFFRKYVPGFEHSRLFKLAERIGVRESRQIVGLHRLTEEEVLEGRQFDDVIAQCCYGVDIHLPNSSDTKLIHLPSGSHYDIPLRCLIPSQGPGNLIVAGRCISATQSAMSSFRVSPSVMAIGEAAGVAAALAGGRRMEEVPVREVQAELLANGGLLS